MTPGTYLIDRHSSTYGSFYLAERVLFDRRSAYQRVQVVETEAAGRILFLDDVFNVSTVMEAFYHEPMAHIPLAFGGDGLRVLVIGGGDFGVARQVLRHRKVAEAVLCELDEMVLDVAREYFPEMAACERDPRLKVHVGDGFAYVRDSHPASWDAVIVDSTDPAEHAPILISQEFYRAVGKALRPDGVLMQIIDDAVVCRSGWPLALPRARRVFPQVLPAFVSIPYYVTGDWGLMLAGRSGSLDPGRIDQPYLDGIAGLRTMTGDRVKGWFSLPPCVARWLEEIDTDDRP